MPTTNTIEISINIELGAWSMACDTDDPDRRLRLVEIAIDLLSDYAKSLVQADADH